MLYLNFWTIKQKQKRKLKTNTYIELETIDQLKIYFLNFTNFLSSGKLEIRIQLLKAVSKNDLFPTFYTLTALKDYDSKVKVATVVEYHV